MRCVSGHRRKKPTLKIGGAAACILDANHKTATNDEWRYCLLRIGHQHGAR